MTLVNKLAADQLTGAALTAEQWRQLVNFARKMANVTTDKDKAEWQWALMACEVGLSQAAGGHPQTTPTPSTAGEPARRVPARRQPQPAKAV